MSPEICIVVVIGISFWETEREKPTLFIRRKASALYVVWRMCRTPAAVAFGYVGPGRGLRAEHVFKGVARKLERANCLLVQFKCIRYLVRIAKSEQT